VWETAATPPSTPTMGFKLDLNTSFRKFVLRQRLAGR
jgi:hypothetical protein